MFLAVTGARHPARAMLKLCARILVGGLAASPCVPQFYALRGFAVLQPQLRGARHPDRFIAPVLLFHGALDSNVGSGESRLMAARLKAAGKRCQLVTFDDVDHCLDDAAARTLMLRDSEAFLRQALPLPPPVTAAAGAP